MTQVAIVTLLLAVAVAGCFSPAQPCVPRDSIEVVLGDTARVKRDTVQPRCPR
jgi:hypothetical protein